MLLAKDIREGNLVLIPDRASGKLLERELQCYTITAIKENTVLAYPIPITEKLLVDRCGWLGSNNIQSVNVAAGTIFIGQAITGRAFIFQYRELKVPLKGLHHLQNIMSDLFDIELEIK